MPRLFATTAYTRLFQLLREFSSRDGDDTHRWLNGLVNGQWPRRRDDISHTDLKTIGRNLCSGFGVNLRHNAPPRTYFTKLLLKLHPDQVRVRLFNNKDLTNINYREWFAAHVLHSFCIHCMKFLHGEQMMDFVCPMPLLSMELIPPLRDPSVIPRRVTSFDALAIQCYATAC